MRKFAAFAAAVTASVALSGCSMIPGLGPQSGPQACAAVFAQVQGAAPTMTQAVKQAYTDPAAAAASVDKYVAEVSQARSKVTNEKVGAALDKAVSSATQLAKVLRAADGKASAVDSTELSDALEATSDALLDLSKACAG